MPSIETESQQYIALIYEAVLDRTQWPHLLEALMNSIQGNSAMLRKINPQTRALSFYESVGYEAKYAEAYRDHFCHLDPYQRFFQTTAVGHLIATEEKLEARKRYRSEYFNDFEVPQDKIYAIGGVMHREAANEIQFGIQRGSAPGNFQKHDRQLLQLLLPHLACAIKLHCALADAEYRQNLAFSAWDKLRLAVFLHHADGKLFYSNAKAESLLQANTISVKAGRLALHNEIETAQLHRLLKEASHGVGGNIRCHSGKAGERLSVWVTPLHTASMPNEFSTISGGIAVFISCLGLLNLPWLPLTKHYGLTHAEAKLAVALADGKSLEEIAEAQCIAYETARSQLKSIFSKTGTRRQPELVALLLKGALATVHNEP
jgi:DNA-binding CsgD family transcriptional regulator